MARAIDDAGIDVAPQAVGAQDMLQAGRAQLLARHAFGAAVAGEKWRDGRPSQDDGDNEPRQRQADRYAAQPGGPGRPQLAAAVVEHAKFRFARLAAAHVAVPSLLPSRGSSTG